MWTRFKFSLMLLLLHVGPSLGAQSIAGLVRDSSTGRGVAEIALIVSTSDGRVIATGRSSSSGMYQINVPAGRRYRIQALRVGHSPTVVELPEIGTAERRTIDITLSQEVVALVRLRVDARDRCGLTGDAGRELLAVWNQARIALALLNSSAAGLDLKAVVVRLSGSSELDGSRARVDSATPDVFVAQLSPQSPTDSTPVVPNMRAAQDAVEYSLPAVETVLSEQFASMHCFRVVRDGSDSTRIGIDFRPAPDAPKIDGDVQGVLWVETSDAHLRALEYRYVHLTEGTSDVCARLLQRSVCTTAREKVPGGGRVDFVQLEDGTILTRAWMINAGLVDGPLRKVSDYDPSLCGGGKRCPLMVIPQRGLFRFSVVSVQAKGLEIFQDSVTSEWLERSLAKSAGKRPARITGRVVDERRHPIANARVELPQLRRAVLSDSAGRFELLSLPPARKTFIQILHSAFDPATFTIELKADQAREVEIVMSPILTGPSREN